MFLLSRTKEVNQKFDESGVIFLPLYLFECSVLKQQDGEVLAFAVIIKTLFYEGNTK